MNTICMKVSVYASVLLFAVLSTNAQSELLNQQSTDKRGNPMLVGTCTRDALLEAPYKEWFAPNFESYTVDSATCRMIAPILHDKQILLFMGTWCGDSKREVPRMLKILDCCGFPMDQLQLVMVSNQDSAYKQSPQHEEQGRKIVRVPTLIILDHGDETGRIIEYPVVTLEKDLLSILRKEHYVPNYGETIQKAR